jgi:hypothetical protein
MIEKEKKNQDALKQAKIKNQESALAKKNYTYDYEGDIIIVKKLNTEVLPSTLAIPRIKEQSPINYQSESNIHKFENTFYTQDEMMKTYFKPPSADEKKETTSKWKKKGWGHFNSEVTPAGSNFEEISMTHGCSIYEGIKNKHGPYQNPNEALSRTEYFEKILSIKGLGDRRGNFSNTSSHNDIDAIISDNVKDTNKTQGQEMWINQSNLLLPPINRNTSMESLELSKIQMSRNVASPKENPNKIIKSKKIM